MHTKATLVIISRSMEGYHLTIHTPNDHEVYILSARHVRDLIQDGACALASDAYKLHSLNSSNPTARIGVTDAGQAKATDSTGAATAQAGDKDNRK